MSGAELAGIQVLIDEHPEWSRHRVAKELCQQWKWRTPVGQLKTFAARSLLLKLAERHQLRLPPLRVECRRVPWGLGRLEGRTPGARPAAELIEGSLASLQPLQWQVASHGSTEREHALACLREHHYLGCNRPVGVHLIYLVRDAQGRDLAVHLVGAAAWQCAARDRYIGWSGAARQAGLPRIANHSRFLILPWVRVPHLASHLLGGLTWRVSEDWRKRHGWGLELLETLWRWAVSRAPRIERLTGSRWDTPRGGRGRKNSIRHALPARAFGCMACSAGFGNACALFLPWEDPMSRAMPVTWVLEIFALLFSNQWVGRWQRQWQQKELLSAGGSRRVSRQAKAAKNKNKFPGLRFYQRIFSLRVTLWYLVYQRLNFDQTLAAVVTNVRAGGADRLGRRGRKLSLRVRSTKTSGYNQARQRMPVEFLAQALAHLRQGVLKRVGWVAEPKKKPGPSERTRQLLDGSTLAVLFTPSLGRVYPPARNQRGASDWCLMRMVVGFCARSGAVLSAMEGAMQRSEQALAWVLMEQASAFTLWIGDRNFGVWSVVAQAVRYRQDVLVRLTGARAAKLSRGRPLRHCH